VNGKWKRNVKKGKGNSRLKASSSFRRTEMAVRRRDNHLREVSGLKQNPTFLQDATGGGERAQPNLAKGFVGGEKRAIHRNVEYKN